jgi:hypothetical protein
MAIRRAPVAMPVSRPSLHPLGFKDYPAAATELRKYDNVGVVGKGSFGVIHKMRRKVDGKVCGWLVDNSADNVGIRYERVGLLAHAGQGPSTASG